MTHPPSPEVRPGSAAKPASLRSNAVGLLGLTVLGAVMMSPAMGIYGTWGPMTGLVGRIVPLVFLAALAISLPNALSYVIVNREMPSAGSAFAWVTRTAGPATGLAAGLVMVVYYVIQVVLQPVLFGLFFNDLLAALGVATGTGTLLLGAAAVTAVVCVTTYRGIESSTRTAVVFLAVETGVLLALCATVIATRAADHELSIAPFVPSQGSGTLSAFWQAVLLGVLSYTGFDVISTVAEESKAPRKLLPRATFLAVVLVGLVWAGASWAFSLSEPPETVARYTESGLTAVTPMAHDFWGWGSILIIVTALSALTAIYTATVLGASRAVYAIAREGLLPRRLARLHPRSRVPHHAMTAVYAVSLACGVGLLLVLRNGIDAFVWWSQAAVFFALVVYTSVNVANLLYFFRVAPERRRLLPNVVLPLVGIAVNVYVIGRSFFGSLWSAGFRLGQSIVVVAVALLVLCAGCAIAMRRRARAAGCEVPGR
ncbi:APC family permease [Amycolatopsis rubida]|uniref:Amino acid transporter n=1 Tax=Amycolatopsis rubida TaxID=112413 RepID=A0A1I5XJE8_9PSEU|nr:APC family permease [Amycolatopsis rubida]SFQ32105.1 Amino acid transporter [Amycolatopsis rubida]